MAVAGARWRTATPSNSISIAFFDLFILPGSTRPDRWSVGAQSAAWSITMAQIDLVRTALRDWGVAHIGGRGVTLRTAPTLYVPLRSSFLLRLERRLRRRSARRGAARKPQSRTCWIAGPGSGQLSFADVDSVLRDASSLLTQLAGLFTVVLVIAINVQTKAYRQREIRIKRQRGVHVWEILFELFTEALLLSIGKRWGWRSVSGSPNSVPRQGPVAPHNRGSGRYDQCRPGSRYRDRGHFADGGLGLSFSKSKSYPLFRVFDEVPQQLKVRRYTSGK